jgi:putative transposase
MDLKELRQAINEAKKEVTGRELEQHDIFQAHNRLFGYTQKAQNTTKSIRRHISSKKHREKSIEYEENVLKSDIDLNDKPKETFEDDEDGYDYYPVG